MALLKRSNQSMIESKGKQIVRSPYASTFRISDIKFTLSKDDLLRYIQEKILTDNDESLEILWLSLAPSPVDQDRYQVATVTFNRIPSALEDCFGSRMPRKSFQITPGNHRSRISIDTNFIGLTPLNDSSNVNFDVDLIFVTGLAGHAFGSWKATNSYTMWVRDFLAEDLEDRQEPRVRILTYGYNSGLLSNNSTAGIAEFAQGLLESVTNARRLSDQQERPIVFVVHSLGGIVVKKALVKASRGTDHQRKVLRATYALICLGVPNRGMRNDELMTMVKGQPNEALISDLSMKSETLQLLHDAFSRIFSVRDSHVISVYETELSNTVQRGESGKWNRDGALSMMVPNQSATKSVHTEASYDQLSRNVDHSALAKFSNRDEDYFNLRGKVFDCVDKSVPTVRARFLKDMQESSHLGSVSSKLYQLPFELVFARNSNFTGGEDLLSSIHERIMNSGFKEVILSGIGGLGKTNIVLEYAYRYQQLFTSVLWVNGSSEETTLRSFRTIAVRLINHYARNSKDATPNYNRIALELDLNGLVDENGRLSLENESAGPIVASVKRWLSRQSNQEWLLILDNVDDLESFAIDSFIPPCDHGAVLITTRRRRPEWLSKSIEMDEMHPEDALHLLLRIARLNGRKLENEDKQAATELTKRLGNLPLALVQAGAYISANQISLRTYLETFKKQFKSVFSDIPLGSNYTEHDKTVFTTWQTSFEAIKRISADASDILEVCSFFSNEDIGEFMLQHGMMIDVMTLRRSLEPLFSYSLAQRKEANDSFYIHPLVHLWGRERLKTTEKIENVKRAVQILRKAVEHAGVDARTKWLHEHRVIAHLEVVCLNVENYKIIEMLEDKNDSFLSDVEGICGIYRRTGHYEKEARMLMRVLQARNKLEPGMNIDTLRVMSALAITFWSTGRWEEAERLELQVLETRRDVLGGQHSDTLDAMSNLAATHRRTGRWEEAERLELQVLETRREVLGDQHSDTLDAMANLAVTHRKTGRWEEAERLELQVLETRREVLGDQHSDTLDAMANLAATHRRTGRWEEAERLELQVLETRRDVLGDQHSDTLEAMANLAATHREAGRWEEAERMELQVLETRREVLGDQHSGTLRAMANLAVTHWKTGRWEEAERLELQVLETRRQVLGDQHSDTLDAMANLAVTHRETGRWEEAERLELQVLETRREVLGDQHSDTLDAMANLAVTHWKTGRWEEAERLELQVLETRREVLGDQHSDTLDAMANLAVTHWKTGRWEEAERLELQVLETRREVLGDKHSDTLDAMANLALTHWKTGGWEEAERLELQVLETRREVLGDQHSDTLDAMANLAATHRRTGRWEEAERLELQVLETRREVLGDQHSDTLDAMANLAATHRRTGRWEEAERLELQVLETRRDVLGGQHSDTLDAMANLAVTHWNTGRWEEAERLEMQVLETRREVLGDQHSDTLDAMANLAVTHRKTGRWEEAERLELEVLKTRREVLGDQHSDTLDAMANLAATHRRTGRWEEVERLELQVLETRRDVLGDQHSDTLDSMANLAATHRETGRWEEAERMELQVLETRREVLGDQHSDTLRAMANLAVTHWRTGRWEEAERLELQVLETRREVLGDQHSDTLDAMANLAATHWRTGRWVEAERLELQVLETRREVLGDQHSDTLDAMANLAATHRETGRCEEAERLDVQVLETRRKLLGELHPDTLRAISNLGSTTLASGRFADADNLLSLALTCRKEVLGDKHPDTLQTAVLLWRTYRSLQRHEQAADLEREYGLANDKMEESTGAVAFVRSMRNLFVAIFLSNYGLAWEK